MESINNNQLIIIQKPVDQVSNYFYLGTTVNHEWDHSHQVRICIEARTAFNEKRSYYIHI